jgi:hypothetical protein
LTDNIYTAIDEFDEVGAAEGYGAKVGMPEDLNANISTIYNSGQNIGQSMDSFEFA